MSKKGKRTIWAAVIVLCVLVLAAVLGIGMTNAAKQNEIHGHLESAQKYLDELNYEQAIVEYMAILEIDPKNPEAVKLLDQAKKGKENQDKVQGYLTDAEQYLQQGHYGYAVEKCRAALEVEPDYPGVKEALENAYLDYAESYVKKGNYRGAEDVLDKGYQVIPTDKLLIRQEELKEEEEQAKKEAEEEARKREEQKKKEEEEKKKQEREKPSSIYQWRILQLGIITKFPWSFTLKEDDESYIYHVYFGKNNFEGEFDQYYEIHVNKETGEAEIVRHFTFQEEKLYSAWKEDNKNVGKKYDLRISDAVKEEYLVDCEKNDIFEKCVGQIDAYLMENWDYGKEHGYHLMMQDLKNAEDFIWKGDVFYLDRTYRNLSLTVEIEIAKDYADVEAKITGFNLDPGDEVSDSLADFIGKGIPIALAEG